MRPNLDKNKCVLPRLECPICSNVFKSWRARTTHLKAKHSENEEMLSQAHCRMKEEHSRYINSITGGPEAAHKSRKWSDLECWAMGMLEVALERLARLSANQQRTRRIRDARQRRGEPRVPEGGETNWWESKGRSGNVVRISTTLLRRAVPHRPNRSINQLRMREADTGRYGDILRRARVIVGDWDDRKLDDFMRKVPASTNPDAYHSVKCNHCNKKFANLNGCYLHQLKCHAVQPLPTMSLACKALPGTGKWHGVELWRLARVEARWRVAEGHKATGKSVRMEVGNLARQAQLPGRSKRAINEVRRQHRYLRVLELLLTVVWRCPAGLAIGEWMRGLWDTGGCIKCSSCGQIFRYRSAVECHIRASHRFSGRAMNGAEVDELVSSTVKSVRVGLEEHGSNRKRICQDKVVQEEVIHVAESKVNVGENLTTEEMLSLEETVEQELLRDYEVAQDMWAILGRDSMYCLKVPSEQHMAIAGPPTVSRPNSRMRRFEDEVRRTMDIDMEQQRHKSMAQDWEPDNNGLTTKREKEGDTEEYVGMNRDSREMSESSDDSDSEDDMVEPQVQEKEEELQVDDLKRAVSESSDDGESGENLRWTGTVSSEVSESEEDMVESQGQEKEEELQVDDLMRVVFGSSDDGESDDMVESQGQEKEEELQVDDLKRAVSESSDDGKSEEDELEITGMVPSRGKLLVNGKVILRGGVNSDPDGMVRLANGVRIRGPCAQAIALARADCDDGSSVDLDRDTADESSRSSAQNNQVIPSTLHIYMQGSLGSTSSDDGCLQLSPSDFYLT